MKTTLQHQLLIAMPGIKNPLFKKTVIYICEHNQDGAMGIIINKPLKNIKIQHILKKLNIESSRCIFGPKIKDPVIMGGPQAKERGFILHSSKKPFYSSIRISDTTTITTSKDILESMGIIEEPQKILVALGYCTWGKNQLEKELLNNFWLTSSANHDILFNIPISKRWTHAAKNIGINMYQLSVHFGHA
ncbi:YqgE/AlgH family protein [Buchnera aphidicola]|uniref:YqgE/AlgH family protein n=1 Tax=Buchnera aphidicola TaxID=9 RepID=UPI0034646082